MIISRFTKFSGYTDQGSIIEKSKERMYPLPDQIGIIINLSDYSVNFSNIYDEKSFFWRILFDDCLFLINPYLLEKI